MKVYVLRNASTLMVLFVLISNVHASQYSFQIDFQSGGEDLYETQSNRALRAGGGLGLGFINQQDFDKNGLGLRFAYAYVFESRNNDMWTHHALALSMLKQLGKSDINFSGSYIGAGLALHLNPTYRINNDRHKKHFDDALGIVLMAGKVWGTGYDYKMEPAYVELGVKYTIIDYKHPDYTGDDSALGLFLSFSL